MRYKVLQLNLCSLIGSHQISSCEPHIQPNCLLGISPQREMEEFWEHEYSSFANKDSIFSLASWPVTCKHAVKML